MFTIKDHWIEQATKDEISGGRVMPIRRLVVEHFTGGATAKSSIEAMKERKVSAHLVVDRDGTVFQCRPFNKTAEHAGVSRWVDPNTNIKYSMCNGISIGIEIANAGNDTGALNWAKKQPWFQSIKARHPNGGHMCEWEIFYPKQVDAVTELTKLLVKTYNLDDISGHENIAPERKDDPGPAFPMLSIREKCGFKGLPTTHYP